ncbi:MAG: hypothetical protein ABI181_02935 [Mycobacteriaceae bacterium]
MNLYRRLWRLGVCLLVVAGTGLAVFVPWGTLLGLGLVGAVLGGLCGAGLHRHRDSQPTPGRYVLAACIWTTVGVIVFAGFAALIGVVALLGVLLVTATCPPAVRMLAARVPWAAAPPQPSGPAVEGIRPVPGPQHAPEPAQNLQELDSSELCWRWRWRTSFTALQHTATPAGRLSLIETRAALLDEMARRNPQGFRCWLNDGARAASDPTRYFDGPQLRRRQPHRQAPKADQ